MKPAKVLGMWLVSDMLIYFLLIVLLFLCCSATARDDITVGNWLGHGETLVSPLGRFVLGFFNCTSSANSSNRTYIGIWYGWDPGTIVWVANRSRPLVNYTDGAYFGIKNGMLSILDSKGTSYWSNGNTSSVSTNITAQLSDNGNLVLSEDTAGTRILWQSFDDPTDTFLPGMKMVESLELVSWKGPRDPAKGIFTFKKDEGENAYVIQNISGPYWKNTGFFPSGNEILPVKMGSFLSNTSIKLVKKTITVDNMTRLVMSTITVDNMTRLVMSMSGKIQYWRWDNESEWSLIRTEPRNPCSVFDACGNFGVCNPKRDPRCTCLPGYIPSSRQDWEAGDFSGGCTVISTFPEAENYRFLNYSNMRVVKTESPSRKVNEAECRKACDYNCLAYSYSVAERSSSSDSGGMCSTWKDVLTNLQEEYKDGCNLFVRVPESTSRNCEICGRMIVPYPLRSGPDCGDPMYFNFMCDASTSQLMFNISGDMYQVNTIDPETRKFTILSNITDNCGTTSSRDAINYFHHSLMQLPFNITRACNTTDLPQKNKGEIEISWNPPEEPTCTSSTDCKDWPSSSCNATGNVPGRCVCKTNFIWDGPTLNCTDSKLEEGSKPTSNDSSRRQSPLVVIVFITVISVSSFTCAAGVYIWRKNVRQAEVGRNTVVHRFDSERHAKDLIETSEFKEEDKKGIDVPFFEFETILAATDNFSNENKLGQGGYGPVYKGKFPGGQEIAVKRLSSVSGQGLQEFKNEVVLIAKLQHRNLVKLWGYCVKGHEKILIYEYMPNRSLDAFIFDSELASSLSWEMRYNIILGIARGLLYLHQDSRLRIIHRDMKTSNILLDGEMNPKISDFGLARIFGGKQNEANTNRVVGTYGYMAPEYALDGFFSVKSDVFSFGVVMLEIISGKRTTGFYRSRETLSLLGYAWRFWEEGDALKLMDQTLVESCNRSEFMKCVHVGLLCVQEEANDRPDMSGVIMMLGSESASLPSPKQPAFIARAGPSSSGIASSSTGSITERTSAMTSGLVEGR